MLQNTGIYLNRITFEVEGSDNMYFFKKGNETGQYYVAVKQRSFFFIITYLKLLDFAFLLLTYSIQCLKELSVT